jgi:twitching motility protein PilT
MDITKLLSFCRESDASDLHLSAGNPPVLRIYGNLKRVKTEPLSSDDIQKIVYPVMSDRHQKQFEEEKELDFAVTYSKDTRFRVNLFRNRGGISAVFLTSSYRI